MTDNTTPQPAAPQPQPTYHIAQINPGGDLGIASLITSLVGLGLPGMILGFMSRSKSKAAGMSMTGLALAGLILGIIQVALFALAIPLMIVLTALGAIAERG